jgi:uncharacterized protein (TIGR02646 family)
VNPFLYPKQFHIRRFKPPIYSRYKQYKRTLQEEFERKCVYCRMPDVWGAEGFGVDHYRPKAQFPELVSAYDNLFYCCNPCNSRKGSYWPAQAKSKHFIPNPCDHVMAQHLRYNAGRVETRTKAGEFTRELLDLNAPDAVRRRNLMATAIQVFQSTKSYLLKTREKLLKQQKSNVSSPSVSVAELRQLDIDLKEIDAAINQMIGAE